MGYDWVAVEGTENLSRKKSRLEVADTEAEMVRFIFELYASGKGYKAIVGYLNKISARFYPAA